tara:strand:- start:86 stop:265 length:180 start_codon:yes stop_codon:yes gene_type:complete
LNALFALNLFVVNISARVKFAILNVITNAGINGKRKVKIIFAFNVDKIIVFIQKKNLGF